MREVLVSQNETFLKKIDDLTEDRKAAQADRHKLLQECADLQEQIESMREREARLNGLEGTNRRLEAERQALAAEVERLRATNTALCAQVFGEMAPSSDGDEAMQMMQGKRPMSSEGGTVAEDSLAMVLQLQKRLGDAQDKHWEERQRLQDRIQELERVNSRQAVNNLNNSAKAQAPQPKDKAPAAPRSWVASLGSGIRAPTARAEPKPAPQGPEAMAAALRGGLTRLGDMLPKP